MPHAPSDWPPAKIRAAIYAKGTSMEALAIAHGYSSATVRVALIRRSPAGERLIGNLLGVRLQDIWPSRYDDSGRSRSRPRRQPQSSHVAPRAHRQIGGAA